MFCHHVKHGSPLIAGGDPSIYAYQGDETLIRLTKNYRRCLYIVNKKPLPEGRGLDAGYWKFAKTVLAKYPGSIVWDPPPSLEANEPPGSALS